MSVMHFGSGLLEEVLTLIIRKDIPLHYIRVKGNEAYRPDSANDGDLTAAVKAYARRTGLVKSLVIFGHENARAFNDRYPDECAENAALDIDWGRAIYRAHGFRQVEIDTSHLSTYIRLFLCNCPDDVDPGAVRFILTATQALVNWG